MLFAVLVSFLNNQNLIFRCEGSLVLHAVVLSNFNELQNLNLWTFEATSPKPRMDMQRSKLTLKIMVVIKGSHGWQAPSRTVSALLVPLILTTCLWEFAQCLFRQFR